MPTISMFFGIIIRMYCAPNEHNPPHFPAYYQDYKAIIDIKSCDSREGMKPYLAQGIFQELKDEKMFKPVRVSFDSIEWSNQADIDPVVLYKNSKVYQPIS